MRAAGPTHGEPTAIQRLAKSQSSEAGRDFGNRRLTNHERRLSQGMLLLARVWGAGYPCLRSAGMEWRTQVTHRCFAMIVFSCAECRAPFQISEEHAGKRATCKTCGAKVLIPSGSVSPGPVPVQTPPETKIAASSRPPTSVLPPPLPRQLPTTPAHRVTPIPSGPTDTNRPQPTSPSTIAPNQFVYPPSVPSANSMDQDQSSGLPYSASGAPPTSLPTAVQCLPEAGALTQKPIYITQSGPAQQTDAPGIISLIFGILAIVFLFFSCIGGYFIAAPVALIGLVLGFIAKGNLRVAGITLNAIVLVPAAVVFIFGMLITLGLFAGAS